jgi:hypothetical protein
MASQPIDIKKLFAQKRNIIEERFAALHYINSGSHLVEVIGARPGAQPDPASMKYALS